MPFQHYFDAYIKEEEVVELEDSDDEEEKDSNGDVEKDGEEDQ